MTSVGAGATLDATLASGTGLRLAPPSPNPARGPVTFEFTLPRAGAVRLSLYDAAGRRVRALREGPADAGTHRVRVELTDDAGRALPPGMYCVRMEAAGRAFSREFVRIR